MGERTEALTVWRLRLEDLGEEVRVTTPTLEAQALAPRLLPLFLSGRQQDVIRAVARMAGPFADSLLSWTVCWKGRPVPCTRRGVLRVDLGLVLIVLREWIALWPAPEVEQGPAESAEVDPEAKLLAGLPMTALVPDDELAEADLAAVG